MQLNSVFAPSNIKNKQCFRNTSSACFGLRKHVWTKKNITYHRANIDVYRLASEDSHHAISFSAYWRRQNIEYWILLNLLGLRPKEFIHQLLFDKIYTRCFLRGLKMPRSEIWKPIKRAMSAYWKQVSNNSFKIVDGNLKVHAKRKKELRVKEMKSGKDEQNCLQD